MENNGNLALNNGQLKGLLLKFHSHTQLFFLSLMRDFLTSVTREILVLCTFTILWHQYSSQQFLHHRRSTHIHPSSPFLWQKYKYISWKNRPLFSLGSITIFYDLSIIFYIGFALNKRITVSLAKSFLALPLAALCHFPFD